MKSDFKKLKKRDARLFLKKYLNESSKGFDSLIPDLLKDHVPVDYTLKTLPQVVDWISRKIVRLPMNPDDSLPKWITDTDVYKKGLYEFDDDSTILILRLSYYWGECFVRNTNLRWGIGRYTTYKNQPVLEKFINHLEMAPFIICENLIRRRIENEPDGSIEICIEYWMHKVL